MNVAQLIEYWIIHYDCALGRIDQNCFRKIIDFWKGRLAYW